MFTGREYDSVSGLYYYRARYYSPNIGRFLQTDPVGYYDSMNLYQYCLNNPVNWIDPYGLYTWSEWGRATAHPFEESKVRTARNNANSATQNKYGHNGGNDESDAYRHAYWNIEMTRSMNKKSAEAWANAHENFEGNPQDEKDMDCKNNKAGRDAAADPANAKKSTDEIVNQLIKDGKLQTSLPKDSIGLPAQYD
jgi:RHS repeat-associated protein